MCGGAGVFGAEGGVETNRIYWLSRGILGRSGCEPLQSLGAEPKDTPQMKTRVAKVKALLSGDVVPPFITGREGKASGLSRMRIRSRRSSPNPWKGMAGSNGG